MYVNLVGLGATEQVTTKVCFGDGTCESATVTTPSPDPCAEARNDFECDAILLALTGTKKTPEAKKKQWINGIPNEYVIGGGAGLALLLVMAAVRR